jgi:hypothetical protein
MKIILEAGDKARVKTRFDHIFEDGREFIIDDISKNFAYDKEGFAIPLSKLESADLIPRKFRRGDLVTTYTNTIENCVSGVEQDGDTYRVFLFGVNNGYFKPENLTYVGRLKT